jgi:aspartate racemase
MQDSARKLAASGADFLICPDNTVHAALDLLAPSSPLPWLHIVDVVAKEASERGYRQIGVMGTQWLVDSGIYPRRFGAFGLSCELPERADCLELSRIIMEELVCGSVRKESIAYAQSVVQKLRDAGCDAVALACTELPLILNDANSALPTLDSTRLLARAALKQAVGH